MSLLPLLFLLPAADALRLSFTASSVFSRSAHQVLAAASPSSDSLRLSTVRDLIYMANITVGSESYPVQLDTGSSDLWLKPEQETLPDVNETSTSYNLTYGIGWAYGHLSFATVQFAGMSVQNQAFVHAQTVNNPALAYGADGILGLGFTSLSSIDVSQQQSQSYSGRSLLYNMFEQNPEEPNFISFSLQRSTQGDDEVEGTFSIGEYEPQYADVANMPSIPTFPTSNPTRWNVLIDAIIVAGSDSPIVPTTTIPDAPTNQAVGLLDTGTSYTYVPKEVAQTIYGKVEGAQFNPTTGYWQIPCNQEVDVAIQIFGQVYPIHPLDVTPVSLGDAQVCIGSFVPQTISVSEGQFDWLIGDNVLRSVYSVFDFGDYDDKGSMGDPFVKLFPLIEPDEASANFAKVRGSTARTGISYNSVNGTRADARSTSVTLSSDVAKQLNMVGKMFPVLLAIMGLNVLVILGLIIFGIVYMCRRRKRGRVPQRTARGRLSPMPMNVRHSYMPGGGPSIDAPHYQPVSMAMTEDTFIPPSAAFQYDSKIQPGDRPRSMAVPLHVARMSASSDPYYERDEPFVPPSPAFHHSDGSQLRPGNGRGVDRPNSVA